MTSQTSLHIIHRRTQMAFLYLAVQFSVGLAAFHLWETHGPSLGLWPGLGVMAASLLVFPLAVLAMLASSPRSKLLLLAWVLWLVVGISCGITTAIAAPDSISWVVKSILVGCAAANLLLGGWGLFWAYSDNAKVGLFTALLLISIGGAALIMLNTTPNFVGIVILGCALIFAFAFPLAASYAAEEFDKQDQEEEGHKNQMGPVPFSRDISESSKTMLSAWAAPLLIVVYFDYGLLMLLTV